MNEEFDVIIVGAGPSGSSCAYFASEKGLKVLLVDKEKFPRDKTCGDGISGKSLKMVKLLGLENEIKKKQHTLIKAVKLSSPAGDEIVLRIPQEKEKEIYGYCCKRIIFDEIMFKKAAASSTKTIEEFNVIDIIKENGFVKGIKGKTKEGKELEFKGKIVVAADGANSLISSKAGIEKNNEKHMIIAVRAYYKNVKDTLDAIELHFLDELIPGYFWIFPVGNNEVNVGLGLTEKERKKKNLNLKKELEKIIKEHSLFKERFKEAEPITEIKGWPLPVGSKRKKPYGNGFLLIGDAASLIDPFTGEGIGNALLSGLFAAETIKKAVELNDYSENTLKEFDEKISNELDDELKNDYMLQKLLTKKFLINRLMKKAQTNPKIKEALAWSLTKNKPLKSYTKLGLLLRMIF